MKLYILQSLYTSDPYEPSETNVYGVYSNQDNLLDNFRGWVDEHIRTVIQGLRNFDKEITDGENKYWQEWRKVNGDKLTETVKAFFDKQKDALLEKDIRSIFKKLKEFNVNDWCGQMDHLNNHWFPENCFAKIFNFMYMDDFFVTEVELDDVARELAQGYNKNCRDDE